MLVLSRKAEEEIRIGEHIVIRVLKVSGSTVKLGIEAPRQTTIKRAELTGSAEGALGGPAERELGNTELGSSELSNSELAQSELSHPERALAELVHAG